MMNIEERALDFEVLDRMFINFKHSLRVVSEIE